MKPSKSTIVAALLAGCLLASIPSACAANAPKKAPAPPPAEFNAQTKAKERVDKAAEKFKLTEEQKQKLLPLYLEETDKLKKETDASLAERTRIRKEFQSQVKESKILTDDQLAKWLEFQISEMNRLAQPAPPKASPPKKSSAKKK